MICTPTEVAAHAGHPPLTADQAAAVTTQITLYQAELEAWLGRAVERAARSETRTLDRYATRFNARYGPVHAVTSVTVGGALQSPSNYELDRNGFELWASYYTGTAMAVVYDGGWEAPFNLPAKQAVMARTARWLNKRTDDDVGTESSAVEGHTVKWMPDTFTEAELAACERLRAPDQAG